MSKNLSEQNLFNKSHKEDDYVYYKSDVNNQKLKPCEYYPIESDKSKNGEHTIYFGIKGGEYYDKDKSDEISEPKDNNRININEKLYELIHKDKKDDYSLFSQRSIELQIYKGKFIFLVDGLQTFKQGNFNNELKIDKVKNRYNDSSDKEISKDIHNIKSIDGNFNPIDIINIREYNDGKKILELNFNNINDSNNKYKEKNTTTTYVKQINIKQSPYKENGFFKNHFNLDSEQLNQSNLLKYNKDYSNKKCMPNPKFFKLNDIKKHSLTKNNSLLDIFPKIKNTLDMNNSFDNKNNINSLEYFKKNINKNLDNSKIMEKSFLSGMKNEDRRNSLKNAITIYNRFKSFGKLKKMNLYSTPLSPLVPKINLSITNNYENDDNKMSKENLDKKDKNLDIKINKDSKGDNTDEKNDKNNDENKIIIKINDTNNNKEDIKNESIEENNEHEFSFTLELKKNLENKENENVEENLSKNNISKDNELFVVNNEIIEQSILDNKGDKQNKENYKKENNNIRKLNKSMDIKRKNNIKSKNNNYFLDRNNNINKSTEVQKKRIKYKNHSHFIRKVIREEHYYIDENGKEKLLEVKQRLINEGNNKEKFYKSPYNKKNLKIKILKSKNKIEENKKTSNSYSNTNSPNYNTDEKEKEAISGRFKKINRKKKKINLKYLQNEYKNISLERTMKKDQDIVESNLTEIMPYSFFSKNNDIFKDFNNFFFKNNLNNFNKKKTIINETKTQKNKIYLKEPNSEKQKNLISFNNLNNNLKMKKDIFSIKKEKPIIIKSIDYEDNLSRTITPKSSLNKTKYLNPNNNLYGKKVFNYYNVKNNNDKNKISVIKENEKSNELKEIYSYIKVNKMEKFKKINKEKISNINKINRSSYPKRGFNKNHAYIEIKAIKNTQKRLSSNSQSNYFSEDISNDELNSSNRTQVYSVNSLKIEKKKNLILNIHNSKIQNDLNKIMTKQTKFQNKSNSDSYFILNTKFPNRIKNNKDQKNHKFYESKSTKKKYKDSDNESDGNTRRYTTNCSITLEKNLYKNDSKDRYFYQNWGNNSSIQYHDNQ